MNKKEYIGTCEECGNYMYDEQEEAYFCEAYMDEDDVARLYGGQLKGCPYYVSNDEYKIVRHQM